MFGENDSNSVNTKISASMRSNISEFGFHTPQHLWSPPTDVYETGKEIVVRVEIAGVNIGDFDIDFVDGVLSIRGNRADLSERKAFHQMEIRYGAFQASLKITIPVNADEISAEYRDGFLMIKLPKASTKRIRISS